MRSLLLGAALAAAFNSSAYADAAIAKDHAPIGVMGDHMHKIGEVMVSYRYMGMAMAGNRIGTKEISSDEIATTIHNRFFGNPMQPPTLRVVPRDMSMKMHMAGVMYAPSEWVTLTAMGAFVIKEMDHLTYQGGMGTSILGGFTTKTAGLSDLKLGALMRLIDHDAGAVRHHAHLNLGFSVPTGSVTKRDQILTPMGEAPRPRLPYPMQLGRGSVDGLVGATYNGSTNAWSWGGQYGVRLTSGKNNQGYRFGDRHDATAWTQYGPADWIAFSARVALRAHGRIDGIDPAIVAPVQTADPDFQGGKSVDIGGGVNFAIQHGPLKGHRFGVEAMVPVYQDLNGPKLATDWTLTAGWQKAF